MIIGICGRARNGKTTVAESILDHAKSLGMTAAVYDIGQMILKYCVAHKLLPSKTREELTEGELKVLVDVGKAKRDESEHFWVDRLFMDIDRDYFDVAIIPNIRYQNEADRVRKGGGVLIKATALNRNGSQYISRDRDPNHPSETELNRLVADYYVTAFKGEAAIVSEYAITVFEHLLSLEEANVGR